MWEFEDYEYEKINTSILEDKTLKNTTIIIKSSSFVPNENRDTEPSTGFTYAQITSSYEKPLFLHQKDNGKRVAKLCEYRLFKDEVYEVRNDKYYDNEKVSLLILDFIDKERKKFEKLKVKFSEESLQEGDGDNGNNFRKIPEKVRIFVWRRDRGKCVKCGSREKLEYDHIIPVSKGGSNTARNIELLCQECNREKSNNIQ